MREAFRRPRILRQTLVAALVIALAVGAILAATVRLDALREDRAARASVDQLAGLLQDIGEHGDRASLAPLVRGWVRTEPRVLRVEIVTRAGERLADAGRAEVPASARSYQATIEAADVGPLRLTVAIDAAPAAARKSEAVVQAIGLGIALSLVAWLVIGLGAAWRTARRRYSVLLATNRLLLAGGTEAELLQRICGVAVREGGFSLAWIGLLAADLTLEVTAAAGPAAAYLDGFDVSQNATSANGQGPAGRALRSGQTVVCNDFATDPTVRPWAATAAAQGIRAAVALPLRHDGRPLGLLCLYSHERGAFDADEVALVEQMAADISLGVDYLRRGTDLAESLARLRRIETTIRAGAFRLVPATGSLWCSDGAAVLLGRAPGFSTIQIDAAPTALDAAAGLVELAASIPAGELDFDLPFGKVPDEVRWLRVVGVVEPQPGGSAEVRGLLQDVSERKALEIGLTRVADAERARIASELHDNLGQVLTGTALLVGTLAGRSPASDPVLAADLRQVAQLLQQALGICRTLAHGSMPDLVHGIGVALEDLARQTTAAGVPCLARVAAAATVLHGEQAVELYRIAQEAVTNALKHAACERIIIELRTTGRLIELSISDDGVGLEPTLESTGVGQRTMRYRAARAGGTIEFRPAPGGGLMVLVRVRRRTE